VAEFARLQPPASLENLLSDQKK